MFSFHWNLTRRTYSVNRMHRHAQKRAIMTFTFCTTFANNKILLLKLETSSAGISVSRLGIPANWWREVNYCYLTENSHNGGEKFRRSRGWDYHVAAKIQTSPDHSARQRLRSSSSSSLIVSRTRLSTVGDRAFPVAAARVWNSLPEHVTSAPSVAVFLSRLKTHVFDISYPDPVWLYSACAVTLVAFGHYDRPCHLLTYLLTECEWLSEWVSSFLTAHYIELPMTSKPLHFCHDAIKYWPTFRTVSPANSAVN